MDEPSTSSDEDQPKPSLIYDGAKWVAPPQHQVKQIQEHKVSV